MLQAEQSDMDSQLEKLQKEFAENNEQIQELLQQSQADDEHMDNLRTQVHDIQSGKLHGHAMETSSRRASEQSSGIGDIGDFSNLALDLGNIALSSNEGPPTPTNEESLGSIIVRGCLASNLIPSSCNPLLLLFPHSVDL